MSTNYPAVYAQGHVTKTIEQFRQSLPKTINSSTLEKLGIAPQNEFRVINLFRFLGFIGDEDQPTDLANKLFYVGDKEFETELSKVVQDRYSELFDLHKEGAWDLDSVKLEGFFRNTDKTTASTGKAQAATFATLATLAGKRQIKSTNKKSSNKKSQNKKEPQENIVKDESASIREKIGLTVRIEINLPADGTESTYDMIFKSIRNNLLNG